MTDSAKESDLPVKYRNSSVSAFHVVLQWFNIVQHCSIMVQKGITVELPWNNG
jgi:hypothetical protein